MKKKEKLIIEMEQIEDQMFMIDMIDHWSKEDEESYNKLSKRMNELKKEMEKLENE